MSSKEPACPPCSKERTSPPHHHPKHVKRLDLTRAAIRNTMGASKALHLLNKQGESYIKITDLSVCEIYLVLRKMQMLNREENANGTMLFEGRVFRDLASMWTCRGGELYVTSKGVSIGTKKVADRELQDFIANSRKKYEERRTREKAGDHQHR